MVTLVVTLGLYCPQTGETVTRQVWYHGGPFDAADDVAGRMLSALPWTATDRYEEVEERRTRNPVSARARWSQLELDLGSFEQGPVTT